MKKGMKILMFVSGAIVLSAIVGGFLLHNSFKEYQARAVAEMN